MPCYEMAQPRAARRDARMCSEAGGGRRAAGVGVGADLRSGARCAATAPMSMS